MAKAKSNLTKAPSAKRVGKPSLKKVSMTPGKNAKMMKPVIQD